jgi:hypothetical protein
MEFKRALKESQDDELQRAIKESSLSVEHVSRSSYCILYYDRTQSSLTFSRPLVGYDTIIILQMYSNKAMALSDMDATYFELEQAALERSLQSCSNQEQGKKQQASSAGRRRRNHGRSLSNESSVAEESGTAAASTSTSAQQPPHPSPNVRCKSYVLFPLDGTRLPCLCLTLFSSVTERCCFPSKHL